MSTSEDFIKYLKNKNMVHYDQTKLNNTEKEQNTNIEEAINNYTTFLSQYKRDNFIIFLNNILSIKTKM